MVADGVHMLVAIALVMVVLRTDRVEPYLIALLTAGLPDLDRYLFAPLLYSGHLSGPLWTHRGITHSLFAFALVAALAYAVGHWRAAALGYGSHLIADFLTGGVRLFAPLTPRLYGLYYDWMLGNLVAGSVAAVVVIVGLGVLVYGDADQTRNRSRTQTQNRAGDDIETLRRRWFR